MSRSGSVECQHTDTGMAFCSGMQMLHGPLVLWPPSPGLGNDLLRLDGKRIPIRPVQFCNLVILQHMACWHDVRYMYRSGGTNQHEHTDDGKPGLGQGSERDSGREILLLVSPHGCQA